MKLPIRVTGVLLFALSGLYNSSASAQAIVSDSFSGTNGASLNGRRPDGNDLPGRTFSTAAFDNAFGAQPVIDTGSGNPSASASTGFNAATFIDISSAG